MNDLSPMTLIKEQIEHLIQCVDKLGDRFDRFEEKVDRKFVSQREFAPVRALVYGFVALGMTALLAAIFALAFRHPVSQAGADAGEWVPTFAAMTGGEGAMTGGEDVEDVTTND